MTSHANESVPAENKASPAIHINRLLWAGPIAVLASVAAVSLIRRVAVRTLNPPATFLPLTEEFPFKDSIIFGTFAVLVFLGVPLQSGADR